MKTPKYFSKRTSPVTGAVMERQPDGTAVQVTPELPYSECMAFVRENRDEMLTLYKVARLAPRRDAARRFVRKILARDLSEAVQIFRDFVGDEDPARFQLLTGDWQLICEKVPTAPSNFSNIIN